MFHQAPCNDAYGVEPMQYHYPREQRNAQISSCAMAALGVLVVWMLLQRPMHQQHLARPSAYVSSMLAQIAPAAQCVTDWTTSATTAASARLAQTLSGGGDTVATPHGAAVVALVMPSGAPDQAEASLARWAASHPNSIVLVHAKWCGHCTNLLNSLDAQAPDTLLVDGTDVDEQFLSRAVPGAPPITYFPLVLTTTNGTIVPHQSYASACAACEAPATAAGAATVEPPAEPTDFLESMFASTESEEPADPFA